MTITATEAPSVVGPINRGLQATCERLTVIIPECAGYARRDTPSKRCTTSAQISQMVLWSGAGFRPSSQNLGLPTVLSKAPRIFCINRTLPAYASYCSITARTSFRTTMVFRLPIMKQRDGAFSLLGITPGLFQCLQVSINLVWSNCSEMLIHLNSASVIGGAQTSPIFC